MDRREFRSRDDGTHVDEAGVGRKEILRGAIERIQDILAADQVLALAAWASLPQDEVLEPIKAASGFCISAGRPVGECTPERAVLTRKTLLSGPENRPGEETACVGQAPSSTTFLQITNLVGCFAI